ncbi:MAG: hypothetical protein IPI01_08085 [Ignavibacteriae bacterium]|nr:hypothetical protein [Ignavibacteriota bacterium]
MVNAVPEALVSGINYLGASRTFLSNVSLFSASYKQNAQVLKADFKVPFAPEGITSGAFKVGGELRHSLNVNDQGTPFVTLKPGSAIGTALVNLVIQQYNLRLDSAASAFPGTNFTSGDMKLTDPFLDNTFGGMLWASDPGG